MQPASPNPSDRKQDQNNQATETDSSSRGSDLYTSMVKWLIWE